jgi:RsiW-degrading membrane proteinase PrsW (M82 family)
VNSETKGARSENQHARLSMVEGHYEEACKLLAVVTARENPGLDDACSGLFVL